MEVTLIFYLRFVQLYWFKLLILLCYYINVMCTIWIKGTVMINYEGNNTQPVCALRYVYVNIKFIFTFSS